VPSIKEIAAQRLFCVYKTPIFMTSSMVYTAM
jgi:hypothetical protein